MKRTMKVVVVCLAVFGWLLVASCSNGGGGCVSNADCGGQVCANGACVQCTQDSHCNQGNKCMVCSGNSCMKKSDCCLTDLDCGGGQRCWNVAGKEYGQCGAAK